MKKTAFLILSLLSFSFSWAQVIEWDGEEAKRDIAQKILVLEEPGGIPGTGISFPAAHNKDFQVSGQPVLNFGFTSSVYWLKFILVNHTMDSVLLELDQTFIPEATLYYRKAGGDWTKLRSGYKVPLSKKPVIDHAQLFPLPPGTIECYLRIVPYVHAIPVRLWNRYDWQLASSTTRITYGIYIGVLLFVIMISLLLYFLLRKTYSILYYAVLVALYIASSAAVMEGYAIYFFPGMEMMYWYRIVPVLDMPVLLIFCVSFLELRRYKRSLFTFTIVAISLLVVYIILLLPERSWVPLIPNLIINQVLALLVFLLAMCIGLVTGKQGNRLGYYFAGSYFIWFALLTLEIVYIQTGLPKHISNISYVSIAIFIEAILLAFLVARRIQQERQSHLRKQFEMQKRIGTMEQEFQHELLHAQLEVQEQILEDISQDIHDNIGLSLVMVNMNLHMVNSPLSDNDVYKIQKSQELVSKVLLELRQLAQSLNTGFISDMGLLKAVSQQVQMVRKSGVLNCVLDVQGHEEQYPAQHELLIFRVIQELITNTIKHANASSLRIVISYSSKRLFISVKDDGKGFDTESLNERTSSGLGLRNMKNRIELINGNFNIHSKPGEGTVTTIEVLAA
jgi:signal transduction histidine kinase